ncbi:MAG: prenyltransferase/squalene oxidase repeat-containing protein [Planctomycetota bacterium]
MRSNRKHQLVCVGTTLVCLLFTGLLPTPGLVTTAHAESVRGTEAVAFEEFTPASRAAIREGLAALARMQNSDGSFSGRSYSRHVGITSIACMAFLANGSTPGRGPYGDQVERGLDFVLKHATESGLLAGPDTSHGPMYGHGFATLFLGEVYGMTKDQRLREPLLKAVRLIIKSQNPQGGWRYHPLPYDADISVTICQVMALRSARNAGISVPKETIDAAIRYVKNCQNPNDGGFRYMISSGSSAFPRSAAGVAALFYAGIYDGEEITKGLAYLDRATRSGNNSGHFWYGHYYCVQAMFQAGGEHWANYFPKIRDQLVRDRNSSGGWNGNDAYATGMALIILQMPNRLKPIFQR